MKQKRYMDIERMKEKYVDAFRKGDKIIIEEKIDGASAAFAYDSTTNKIVAFSRRNELNEFNNLRGFYEYTQHLDVAGVAQITENGRYIIFGEWLVSHTVKYPEHEYKHFWMFDVWDTQTENWLDYNHTRAMHAGLELVAQKTNESLNFVPVFYDGPFISWEHLHEMVGKSAVGAKPCGEGIVIKNQTTMSEKEWRLPTYIKIVAKEFSEVHQSKPQKEIDSEKLAAKQAAVDLAATIVTARRVEKFIQKLVEDNILPEDWDEKSLGVIAKNLPRAVYNDCVKEEPETVSQIEDFGKICGSLTMKLAREMIK